MSGQLAPFLLEKRVTGHGEWDSREHGSSHTEEAEKGVDVADTHVGTVGLF